MPQHRIPPAGLSLTGPDSEALQIAIAAELESIGEYLRDEGDIDPANTIETRELRDRLQSIKERLRSPSTHAIVIDAYEETPTNKRYSVVGLYPSHEAAYADMPRVVRELIEDPIEEAEVEQIADTGDGEVFGFFIWIAPWSSGR